jgi:hypothetical protein
MSHSETRYRIQQEEMERRRRATLQGQCQAVEDSCVLLASQLDGKGYQVRDKSAMSSSQLEDYLRKLRSDEGELKTKVEVRDWRDKCKAAESRIVGLAKYLEVEDTFTASTGAMGLAGLKKHYREYQRVLLDLEARKHQKLRLEAEKKIHDNVARLTIEDTRRIGSQNKTRRGAVERNSFDLERYKNLVIGKLNKITDIDFVSEHIASLARIQDAAQYGIWLLRVKRKIEQERLLGVFGKKQLSLLERLPLLPDGPDKNTLRVEIAKLTEPQYWGEEYDDWERNLQQREAAISEYMDKELSENETSRYLIDCLEEILPGLGIKTTGHSSVSKGVASLIGKLDASSKYGLSILIDQDTEEIRYTAVLLDGQSGSLKELSAFEKSMCPVIYALVDGLEQEYGVKTEFTISTPPVLESDTSAKVMTQQDTRRETQNKQRQHTQRRRQKVQRMQMSLDRKGA